MLHCNTDPLGDLPPPVIQIPRIDKIQILVQGVGHVLKSKLGVVLIVQVDRIPLLLPIIVRRVLILALKSLQQPDDVLLYSPTPILE